MAKQIVDALQFICGYFVLSGSMANRLWCFSCVKDMLKGYPAFVFSWWACHLGVLLFHESDKNITVDFKTFNYVSYLPAVIVDTCNVFAWLKSRGADRHNGCVWCLHLCFIQYNASMYHIHRNPVHDHSAVVGRSKCMMWPCSWNGFNTRIMIGKFEVCSMFVSVSSWNVEECYCWNVSSCSVKKTTWSQDLTFSCSLQTSPCN